MKIRELAGACNVAESTVTRFVRKIRYNSFQELKINIAEESAVKTKGLDEEELTIYDDVLRNDRTEDILKKVFFRNIQALQDTLKIINTVEIDRAVEAIKKADLINIYCVGTSTLAAQNAKLRFYRIGKQCIVYNDPAEQAVSAATVKKGNMVIGISNSGKTTFTLNPIL